MRREASSPFLVAVCGNPLGGEDGFGPMVARRLRGLNLSGVDWVEETPGTLALLDLLPGREKLWIVDGVWWPGTDPGRTVDLDWSSEARPRLESEAVMSTHGLSVPFELEMAEALNLLPPVVRVVGVTIKSAAPAKPPSRRIHNAAGHTVRKIQAEATRLQVQIDHRS